MAKENNLFKINGKTPIKHRTLTVSDGKGNYKIIYSR
jgi:hypothetical protein